jgi:hypothetical protein
MNPARCASPLSLPSAVDYLARELPPAEEEAIEAHIFECDLCAERTSTVEQLAAGVRRLAARRGGLAMVLTPSLVERLDGQGVKMRHYRARPGDKVLCSVGAEDDLVVSWLNAELGGIERADLFVYAGGDHLLQHWPDIPFSRVSGQVIYALDGEQARTWPSVVANVQLKAVDGASQRLIAEYTFEHTAFGENG